MMTYGIADVGNACLRTMAKLDCSANNIANVSTPGFKVEFLNYLMRDSGRSSNDKAPSYDELLTRDYSSGALQRTDNPLEVALLGEGFFIIQTAKGVAYTRRGDFTLNMKRELVTKSGDPVLGKTGTIVLNGEDVRIDESGNVHIGENQVGQLKIVSFKNPEVLTSSGEGIFRDEGKGIFQENFTPKVVYGSLELSNVSAIKEMIQMIDLQRTFETYQKLIHSIDEQDKLSAGRIGKVG